MRKLTLHAAASRVVCELRRLGRGTRRTFHGIGRKRKNRRRPLSRLTERVKS